MRKISKEAFRANIEEALKVKFRRRIDEATPQMIYHAVAYAVNALIADDWMETQEELRKENAKRVYYLSMEFLMGRALGNNILNLGAQKEIREVLDEIGFDLNAIEDKEPDPALGNGGLGRLAACFLDSLATLGYPAYGCGIRYRYGMFRQKIVDGYQVEAPDDWLKDGYPFELRRPEYAVEVRFGGYVNTEWVGGKSIFVHEGYQAVRAVPYDMPIVGYGNHVVDTLRIWDAEPLAKFNLEAFDRGDYVGAVEQQDLAKNLVEVLYPNDNHYAG
ncbi:MAG: glycogen/starch/alpha-glucan phosphorylase, partial [Clostridium sp.]|nr:glycogen/starch/alpha-glucan phosphorylase [Clostridium sp.]